MSDDSASTDGTCGKPDTHSPRTCTFGMMHAGQHSWESRPSGIRLFGGITHEEVIERCRTHPHSLAARALAAAGPRTLINKVLTLELHRVDRSVKPWKHGPVEARVKGWDAADEFLKSKGTALKRETLKDGIKLISMPEGWDSMVVEMENHYSDGTVEAW